MTVAVMLNPKTGELIEVEIKGEIEDGKSEEERKLEKKGFTTIDYRFGSERKKYKVIYCDFHKRYECYYNDFIRTNIEEEFTDFAFEVAEILKDCRFFRKFGVDDKFAGVNLYNFEMIDEDYDIKYLSRYLMTCLKIVRRLNEIDRMFIYFFLKSREFREDVILYFEDRKYSFDYTDYDKDKKRLEEMLDDYLKEYVKSFEYVWELSYLVKASYKIKQMFGKNKLIKKYLRAVNRKILNNLDEFFKHFNRDYEIKYYAPLIYELTENPKVLKYLI